MNIEEDKRLREMIRNYKGLTKSLCKRLDERTKSIIPEIEPRLPLGYSINREESGSFFQKTNPKDRYPSEVGIELRLLYNKKPISALSEGERGLFNIWTDLEPVLKELEKRHGLNFLYVLGEPLQIP